MNNNNLVLFFVFTYQVHSLGSDIVFMINNTLLINLFIIDMELLNIQFLLTNNNKEL